jgi:hypothetical protein
MMIPYRVVCGMAIARQYTFFGPIVRGAVATLGKPVDLHGTAILDASPTQSG